MVTVYPYAPTPLFFIFYTGFPISMAVFIVQGVLWTPLTSQPNCARHLRGYSNSWTRATAARHRFVIACGIRKLHTANNPAMETETPYSQLVSVAKCRHWEYSAVWLVHSAWVCAPHHLPFFLWQGVSLCRQCHWDSLQFSDWLSLSKNNIQLLCPCTLIPRG